VNTATTIGLRRRPPVIAPLSGPTAGITGALLVLCVLLAATEPRFLSWGNLTNIAETNAVLAIVAVGMTFVIIGGGFDLSVGGMLALSSVMLSQYLSWGIPLALAIVLTVAQAVVTGLLLNGMLIARGGLSFFVVTLGTSQAFRGIALLITGGTTRTLYGEGSLRTIGSGRIGGVPYLVIVAVVVAVLAAAVLGGTTYGRMVHAVGDSPEAARIAGLRVVAVRASLFAISAGLAAVAAVAETGRLASASSTQGTGLELTAAAAVLLGGTSFSGGSGSVTGTVVGVAFLGVLSNGLSISGISSFWQGVVTGAVLVAAVLLDRLRTRRAS